MNQIVNSVLKAVSLSVRARSCCIALFFLLSVFVTSAQAILIDVGATADVSCFDSLGFSQCSTTNLVADPSSVFVGTGDEVDYSLQFNSPTYLSLGTEARRSLRLTFRTNPLTGLERFRIDKVDFIGLDGSSQYTLDSARYIFRCGRSTGLCYANFFIFDPNPLDFAGLEFGFDALLGGSTCRSSSSSSSSSSWGVSYSYYSSRCNSYANGDLELISATFRPASEQEVSVPVGTTSIIFLSGLVLLGLRRYHSTSSVQRG